MRVRIPIRPAPLPEVVLECQVKKHATSNVLWVSKATIKDLRGVAADIVLTEPDSVPEYAIRVGNTGDLVADYDYFGAGHGHENKLTSSIKLDGREIGEAAGVGAKLVIEQTMELLMPAGADAGEVIGSGTLKHTFDATGLLIDSTQTFPDAGYSVQTGYGAMHIGSYAVFDRAQAANHEAIVMLQPAENEIPETGQSESWYQYFHSNPLVNPYYWRMTLPYGTPELNTAWADITAPKAWLFKRTVHPKRYCNFKGDTREVIPAGTTWVHRQFYQVSHGAPA